MGVIPAVGCQSASERRRGNGNPGFPVETGIQFRMFMVPCFCSDNFWIPAEVYPVLCYGAGMTD